MVIFYDLSIWIFEYFKINYIQERNSKSRQHFSAASAGGGPGAEGAWGRLQVGQEVQRLQHKQSLDKVIIDIQTLWWGSSMMGQKNTIMIYVWL